MNHASLHPSDPSGSPPEEPWNIERAIKDSFDEQKQTPHEDRFTAEDHLEIARSGAADLSNKEKFSVFEDINAKGISPLPEYKRESRPIPLFFGSWTGMNPFRFLKPFHLKRKRS
jgi:hypothetical protein